MSGAAREAGDAHTSGDPIGTAQERELIERPFGAGFLKLACPGDQQDEPTWILRFSDPDIREAVFIGEDAEREAWAAWNRYAPSYNCYLFQIASIEAADALQSRIAEDEKLRSALNLCRERFAEYVTLHKAKLRPERARVGNQHARDARNAEARENVARNQDMVDLCDAALSQHGKL